MLMILQHIQQSVQNPEQILQELRLRLQKDGSRIILVGGIKMQMDRIQQIPGKRLMEHGIILKEMDIWHQINGLETIMLVLVEQC